MKPEAGIVAIALKHIYFPICLVSLFNIPQGYYRNRNRNDATLRNFYADIAWLRRHVTSNDTVIVYFSGHGTKVPDRDREERDGQDEAIRLLDAKLIDDDFSREMNTLPTKHVIAFIDSCFSAGLSKSGTHTFGRRLKYYNTTPSTKGFLISASSEYNPSYEHPKYGGEFTNSLMDELIGRNNSRNKGKTLRTIINNAYKRLRIKGGSIQNFIHPSNILDKIYLSH